MLSNERTSGHMREHNQLNGWSSDENDWNEKLYPVWKRGDPRWKNSWKGKWNDSTQTTVISYLSQSQIMDLEMMWLMFLL